MVIAKIYRLHEIGYSLSTKKSWSCVWFGEAWNIEFGRFWKAGVSNGWPLAVEALLLEKDCHSSICLLLETKTGSLFLNFIMEILSPGFYYQKNVLLIWRFYWWAFCVSNFYPSSLRYLSMKNKKSIMTVKVAFLKNNFLKSGKTAWWIDKRTSIRVQEQFD